MDEKEGSGNRVGLHWETLGVGGVATLHENTMGGDGGGGVY